MLQPCYTVCIPRGALLAVCIFQRDLLVPGWCNGTASSCTLEADFSVRLGPLHFGGPSTEQARPKSVRPPPVVRGAFLFKAVLPPILGIFPAFAGETLLEFGVMLHSFKPASFSHIHLHGIGTYWFH